MHVVEIFLPLKRNDGADQPRALFGEVRRELIERFGGLTAFTRAPAEGLWEDPDGSVDRDQIVIFEVMAEAPDDMHEHTRHFLRGFERLAMNEAIADRAFVLMQTHGEPSLRRLIPWATAQVNALLFVTADPPRTHGDDAGVLVPYQSRRSK